jgi:drug/metabolite transporter (DMT)-like permease
VEARLRGRLVAAGLSVVAAFLWATYYLFVLAVTPGTRPSAVLFVPFAAGGGAFALWSLAHHRGRAFVRAFGTGGAYVRLALLLGMQISVLAATYLTGAVDASLLALLGDVVATPVVVAVLSAEHRAELRIPGVALGLLLSVVGGVLAIAGGHGVTAVHALGWLAVAAVPICVALYFVLSARAATAAPVSVVVGQSMLAAAIGALLLAPLLPGGVAGILGIGAWPLTLLVVNGLASFFVAQLCYFLAIERAGLALPPMLMTGIPVFTLLLSATILGIAPATLALLGVPIAVVGGVVALAAGARAPAAPTASP